MGEVRRKGNTHVVGIMVVTDFDVLVVVVLGFVALEVVVWWMVETMVVVMVVTCEFTGATSARRAKMLAKSIMRFMDVVVFIMVGFFFVGVGRSSFREWVGERWRKGILVGTEQISQEFILLNPSMMHDAVR